MRIESISNCLKNFSDFYEEKGKLIQKVASIAVALLTAISLYDIYYNKLPYKLKIIVNGTLIFLISSILASFFIKKVEKKEEALKEPPKDESLFNQKYRYSPVKSEEEEDSDAIEKAKCNLLSKFSDSDSVILFSDED